MELFFLLAWFGVCAEQDARQREISNWLTLGGTALALGYLCYRGQSWMGAEPGEAGWALLLALALTLPGYALRSLGAGDVKLMAGLALASDRIYLLGSLVGAALAMLAWLLLHKKVWPLMNHHVTQRYHYMSAETTNKYPFSPFLFTGLLLTAAMIH
ncbi:prepilin peptidase [Pseudomonas sp. CDFA 602]|uniref:prepilin peptidase n=1 Tax=Pseudomonas californiensis TaxID=2829823 RepID=UPI001E28B36F|nr:prepilin peptidase [Pseudomonas californiensis]MCD5994307.1 prepilin peptidase [Pseudomonas californiensis]MCD5999985.1 prepilin peptidase [Pseudomonas californiensis]